MEGERKEKGVEIGVGVQEKVTVKLEEVCLIVGLSSSILFCYQDVGFFWVLQFCLLLFFFIIDFLGFGRFISFYFEIFFLVFYTLEFSQFLLRVGFEFVGLFFWFFDGVEFRVQQIYMYLQNQKFYVEFDIWIFISRNGVWRKNLYYRFIFVILQGVLFFGVFCWGCGFLRFGGVFKFGLVLIFEYSE